MLFWMCGGMSLPLVLAEDEDVVAEPPFFLRRIMRGAALGAEAADGSASVVMMACFLCGVVWLVLRFGRVAMFSDEDNLSGGLGSCQLASPKCHDNDGKRKQQ